MTLWNGILIGVIRRSACVIFLSIHWKTTELLEAAFKLYQELQDCNCTFNDTLNTIFDKIELMVQQNAIALQAA